MKTYSATGPFSKFAVIGLLLSLMAGGAEPLRYTTTWLATVWQQGSLLAAECLVTGKELLVTPEQALHVLEIITAARESSASGHRIKLDSIFNKPIVT